MTVHTPPQTEASRRRSSVSMIGLHQPNFGSSIPRVRSTIANARAANSQPSFDFLAGESPQEQRASRSGADLRKSSLHVSSNDPHWHALLNENEEESERRKRELDDLKVENKSLTYAIDNYKQDLELSKLRHETELRDVTRRADEDFKKMQMANAERIKAERQSQALHKEILEIKELTDQEKATLEKKLREMEDIKRKLEEELVALTTESTDTIRVLERKLTELGSRNDSIQQTTADLHQDIDNKVVALQDLQQKLFQSESLCGKQEAEILRLKADISDNDSLTIIKRELTEQVSHIKKLEQNNRELTGELKYLKKIHKSVEVVEEEKLSLQRRLDAKEDLELELREAQIQRQRLQDEQLSWTAYLKSQAGSDGDAEFESPEAVARALIEERLKSATLIERLGSLNQELSNRENILQSLEKEKQSLVENLEKMKKSEWTKNSGKSQLRLERQKALAIKEAEYLRAQLKTYDTEDLTFHPDSVDEVKIKRISELEDMVDQYRQELQTLNDELAAKESKSSETLDKKRKFDDSRDNDHQDQLIRKLRNLQIELDNLQNCKLLLEKDLSVANERLEAMTQQSKTRILSLRSNPTSDHEAIKTITLNTLRQENADLLARIQSLDPLTDSVPSSTLAASQLEVSAAQEALASEKKRNDRLIKVWGAKSTEFRQMVISLLGWDVVFMRDGKTRMTSFFYPSKSDDENSIVFDGEKGTMKICGGPESPFAIKISDQIRFWCKERGSIPCFLAALTLEFWEEMNGDRTLRVID